MNDYSEIPDEAPVVLIDCDVLCYLACESRWKNEAGQTVVVLDDEVPDPVAEAIFLEKAWIRLQELIKDLCEKCYSNEFRAAVAGEGNFRKDIFPAYKMNRHAPTARRNPYVPKLRLMAVAEGFATAAHGMEADDLLRIWQNELSLQGRHYVIGSIDKDLLMIPGQHYRIHHKEFVTMSEEASLRFYYEQLLQGDLTDNIQGAPGIGPVKAKALLEHCDTEAEFQSAVMQVYYSLVHQWSYALNLTGHLIYLRKTHDDQFDLDAWPDCELVDIIEKPKKSKKKMEEWTIATALAAIDPHSITTRERWEAAAMFLIEIDPASGMGLVSDSIEELQKRDKVPMPEIVTYHKLVEYFRGLPTESEVPVETMLLETPGVSPFLQIVKLETPPTFSLPLVAGGVITEVSVKPTETLTVPPVKSLFAIPAVVGVPVFNASWGKK